MNDWTELLIEFPVAHVETVSAIANMAVPYGIYIEDYSNLEAEAMEIAHIDSIDAQLLQKDRSKAWVHLYISPEENPAEAVSFLEERLQAEAIPYQLRTANCAQEDWMHNWKKYFKPIPVGERLLIRPVWEEQYEAQDRLVLHLEPGVAFGTGSHETTRLCLTLMERYLKPGGRMLDVGCGSGILSIAGLLLGAQTAVGVDIDELAVKTARENAALNEMEDCFTALHGSLTKDVTGSFDLVAANIVADVVMELTESISAFLNPDAVYLISGIIDTRSQEVAQRVAETFDIVERLEENGWVAMACKQKAAK